MHLGLINAQALRAEHDQTVRTLENLIRHDSEHAELYRGCFDKLCTGSAYEMDRCRPDPDRLDPSRRRIRPQAGPAPVSSDHSRRVCAADTWNRDVAVSNLVAFPVRKYPAGSG